MLDDVLDGLSRDRKHLPCKWLYDKRGSELFEDITVLPEYYLTRTETRILRDSMPAMAQQIGRDAVLVEYGAGASVKTRIVLDALDRPAAYVPIDVAEDMLKQAKPQLQRDYPDLKICPLIANFLRPPALPAFETAGRRAGFFPGSTIGNLSDEEIVVFLERASEQLGRGAALILGADLKKSPDILVPAYDDEQGVTAAFNLNLLHRINRELDADFDLEAFRHEARWNEALSRMEMHLVSTVAQDVTIDGKTIPFAAGESIHTENSRKFDMEALSRILTRGPWRIAERFSDADNLYSVLFLTNS